MRRRVPGGLPCPEPFSATRRSVRAATASRRLRLSGGEHVPARSDSPSLGCPGRLLDKMCDQIAETFEVVEYAVDALMWECTKRGEVEVRPPRPPLGRPPPPKSVLLWLWLLNADTYSATDVVLHDVFFV